jgi:hypothetical protein
LAVWSLFPAAADRDGQHSNLNVGYSGRNEMGGILPVWWSQEVLNAQEDDPIGCPVSVEQITSYLRPMLSFEFTPKTLEFLQKGVLAERRFWLWAFYDDDGHRWNLIVFSDPNPLNGSTMRTWMCADDNPYALNDDEYILAIHNKEY